jgi:hypothetical protein
MCRALLPLFIILALFATCLETLTIEMVKAVYLTGFCCGQLWLWVFLLAPFLTATVQHVTIVIGYVNMWHASLMQCRQAAHKRRTLSNQPVARCVALRDSLMALVHPTMHWQGTALQQEFRGSSCC